MEGFLLLSGLVAIFAPVVMWWTYRQHRPKQSGKQL